MSRVARWLLPVLLLSCALALAADEPEGEVHVMLVFTQTTSPQMLNRIRADIGTTEPTEEVWSRGAVASKKLKVESYTVSATKAEVCAFENCYPCPNQTRTVRVEADQRLDVIFRWKARYDRVEKKWNCM